MTLSLLFQHFYSTFVIALTCSKSTKDWENFLFKFYIFFKLKKLTKEFLEAFLVFHYGQEGKTDYL